MSSKLFEWHSPVISPCHLASLGLFRITEVRAQFYGLCSFGQIRRKSDKTVAFPCLVQLESIITKLLYSFLYQTVAGFSLHSLSAISILPVLASVLQDGNMAPRLQSKSEASSGLWKVQMTRARRHPDKSSGVEMRWERLTMTGEALVNKSHYKKPNF